MKNRRESYTDSGFRTLPEKNKKIPFSRSNERKQTEIEISVKSVTCSTQVNAEAPKLQQRKTITFVIRNCLIIFEVQTAESTQRSTYTTECYLLVYLRDFVEEIPTVVYNFSRESVSA